MTASPTVQTRNTASRIMEILGSMTVSKEQNKALRNDTKEMEIELLKEFKIIKLKNFRKHRKHK